MLERVIIGLGLAALAAAAEALTAAITGKGIVERVTGQDPYGWWCTLREEVLGPWVRAHPDVRVTRVLARMLVAVNTAAVLVNRLVKACLLAETDGGRRLVIVEEYELPASEVGEHAAGEEVALELR